MFDDKPIKVKNFWGINREGANYTPLTLASPLYDRYFPEVTFENSPQMVELKLIKEE
jgi:hypothetical protein